MKRIEHGFKTTHSNETIIFLKAKYLLQPGWNSPFLAEPLTVISHTSLWCPVFWCAHEINLEWFQFKSNPKFKIKVGLE